MSIEAMKQALEALEYIANTIYVNSEQEANAVEKALGTITSLRQAIAEAEKQLTYTGNGTAGRENMTAPTGFFFQMPKTETQEPAQEPVKPYAYEYGRDNGDGTYSVVIDRGSLVQTQPAVYNYVRPQNAHKDWPIKELFDRPPAAQRQWVGLTLTEMENLRAQFGSWNYPTSLLVAVENILEKKNT